MDKLLKKRLYLRNLIVILISIFILPSTVIAIEDFTTYTEKDPYPEGDPDNRITVTPNQVTYDLKTNEDIYFYKDMGVGYFSNFEHTLEVKITGADSWLSGQAWALSNSISDMNSDGNHIFIILKKDDNYKIQLGEKYSGYSGYTDTYIASLDTSYYLKIKKEGTSLTCEIYSNAARTDPNLLATLSLNLHENVNYRHIYAARSDNWGADRTISGYTKNLDLGEAPPTTSTTTTLPGTTSTTTTIPGATTTTTTIPTTTTTVPSGGNPTTVGVLELNPTFEQISVYSNFFGDSNGNNNALLEYREVGTSEWKPGIPMTPDRRDQYSRYDSDLYETVYEDNPYKNQWRSVIFWLQPNTDYEVRVTYTDPDGIDGPSSVTSTVRTRNDNPPSNGNTYYVATTGSDSNLGTFAQPFRTIQKAVDIVQPGDTVLIMPGTYYEEVIIADKSGAVDNYITFRSYDLDDKAIIDGEGTRGHNLILTNSDYIGIKGLDLRYPSATGDSRNLLIEYSSDNNIIEDCIMTDPGDQWACSGILIREGRSYTGIPCRNNLIQRNYIIYTGDDRAQRFGIFSTGSGHTGQVIRNNIITGYGFKDGIAGDYPNGFIYDNYVEGSWDDGFEIEGLSVNTGFWGNTADNTGHMGIGLAPTFIGPIYVFRNIFIDVLDAGFKVGNSATGTIYLYHNTLYTGANGIGFYGNNAKANNIITRNNIIRVGRYTIECSDPDPAWGRCDFDYDNLYSTSASKFAKWQTGIAGAYITFDGFRQGTGYESHGISADSQFINPVNNDFHLQSTSPNIDKGVVLPGFNDQNSPWPYTGTAPDIGAYEYDSGYVATTTTIIISTTTTTTSTTTTIQACPSSCSSAGECFDTCGYEYCWGYAQGSYTCHEECAPDGEYGSLAFDCCSKSLNLDTHRCYTETTTTTTLPCTDVGLGNPTINPISPTENQVFQIECNALQDIECIRAYANDDSNECVWKEWQGLTAIFDCTGMSAGNYIAKCKSVTGTSSDCCLDEKTKTFTVNPSVITDDSTTVGVLELVPAFEHISIYSSFSGDDNGNNFAYAEYKEVGTSTWLPTVHLSPDRRDQIPRSTYDIPGELYYTDNPWQNQWRGIVFWLKPNTEYDVRVTYTDPDGSSGSVIEQVRTRNDNPPSNGNTYYVSTSGTATSCVNGATFGSIQSAVDCTQPSDTVSIMPGTYYELVTIPRSGTANNYITIQSNDLNNKAIINGQRTHNNNIFIDGHDYIRIRGLDLRNVRWEGDRHGNVDLRNGADNIIIEDNVITGIGGAWRAAGILIQSGGGTGTGTPCNNILIQRNHITDGNPTQDRTSRNLIAVWNPGGSGYVIRNNILTDGAHCEDGFATSSDLMKDLFVYNNYVSAGYDDALEAEGEDINTAYWGNTLVNPWPEGGSFCRMGFGLAPVAVGPLYMFRNTLIRFGDATLKYGNSATGAQYFYHNTIFGRGPATFGNNNQLGNVKWRNNIMHSRGGHPVAYLSGPMEVGSTEFFSSNDFDYDLFWQNDAHLAIRWNYYQGQTGVLYDGTTSSTDIHAGLDPWTDDTGQEVHGINTNPQFIDEDNNNLYLQSTSPAIDRGTFIIGINDQNSPWPYTGTAPDIGAFEYDSGYVVTTTSTTISTTTTTIPGVTTTSISSTTTTTTLPCTDVGLGNPTINPSSPTENQVFQIECQALQGIECIRVYANDDSNECTWIEWQGSTAIFDCLGMPAGNYIAKCKSVTGTSSDCCASETIHPYTIITATTTTTTTSTTVPGATTTTTTTIPNATTSTTSTTTTTLPSCSDYETCQDCVNYDCEWCEDPLLGSSNCKDSCSALNCLLGECYDLSCPGVTTTTTVTSETTTTTIPNATTTTLPTNATTTTITPTTTITTPEPEPTPSSGGGGGGGGGGGRTIITQPKPPEIKEITEEIPEIESELVLAEQKGVIELQITDVPDIVESGEPYEATISLLSDKSYNNLQLDIGDTEETIDLNENEEKQLTYELTAPEAKGAYTLTAIITDGATTTTTDSKTINLDYKPLFVYTTQKENQLEIILKNFEEESATEIEISKDRQSVYVDYIKGKKEYETTLALQPGTYKIFARTITGAGVVDIDTRTITIAGEPKETNYAILYGVIIILVIVFILIISSLFRREEI